MKCILWFAMAVVVVGVTLGFYGADSLFAMPRAFNPVQPVAEKAWPEPHPIVPIMPSEAAPERVKVASADTFLPLLPQIFSGATANADTLNKEANLYYIPGVYPVYTKALYDFALPDLGTTPAISSAILHVWMDYQEATGTESLNVDAYTTTDSWGTTNTAAEVNGLTLSALLDSVVCAVHPAAYVQFDITAGVQAAYSSGSVTAVLFASDYTNAPGYVGNNVAGLGVSGPTSLNFHSLHGVGDTNLPYIVITYTEGTTPINGGPGTAGEGANSGTVGTLLF